MYEIVTSATPTYYPGVLALWNSIQINSPKCSLTVYAYDSTDMYKKLESLGIKVILNAELPGPIYGKGHLRTCTGAPINEDMYARLLVQNDFEGRVFYVDADCIILHPIYELWDELDLQGLPTACVYRPDIGWAGGNGYDDMASGTFLADAEKWREMDILGKCFGATDDTMSGRSSRSFSMNVESVMSHIHNKRFVKLDRIYQNLTYYGLLSKEDKVAHFAEKKPWHQWDVNYKQLWHAYFNHDLEGIKAIEEKLPEQKANVVHPSKRYHLRASQNKWSRVV